MSKISKYENYLITGGYFSQNVVAKDACSTKVTSSLAEVYKNTADAARLGDGTRRRGRMLVRCVAKTNRSTKSIATML